MWPMPICAGRDCVTPRISSPAQLGQGRVSDATILPFHSEQGARQSRTRGRSGASNRSIWIGGLLVGTLTCMGLVWQLRERGEAALQASLVVAAATPVAASPGEAAPQPELLAVNSLGPRRCGQAQRRGAEPQALRAGPSRRRLQTPHRSSPRHLRSSQRCVRRRSRQCRPPRTRKRCRSSRGGSRMLRSLSFTPAKFRRQGLHSARTVRWC